MPEQPAVLTILLLVYAVAILINAVISGLLFAKQRDRLSRAQLMMWLTTLFALIAQGAFGAALPMVLVGLLAVFAVSSATAHLLSIMADMPVPWRKSLGLLALEHHVAAVERGVGALDEALVDVPRLAVVVVEGDLDLGRLVAAPRLQGELVLGPARRRLEQAEVQGLDEGGLARLVGPVEQAQALGQVVEGRLLDATDVAQGDAAQDHDVASATMR